MVVEVVVVVVVVRMGVGIYIMVEDVGWNDAGCVGTSLVCGGKGAGRVRLCL